MWAPHYPSTDTNVIYNLVLKRLNMESATLLHKLTDFQKYIRNYIFHRVATPA